MNAPFARSLLTLGGPPNVPDHPLLQTQAEPRLPHANGERLLIVADDEENDFTLLACAAEEEGVPARLQWAETGRGALQALDTARAGTPVYIVTNTRLLDMDGFDLLHQVRARAEFKAVRFSFLAVHWDPATDQFAEALARTAKVDALFWKPSEWQRLREIARELRTLMLTGSS
jgi:CheY-like chemotaxis protein